MAVLGAKTKNLFAAAAISMAALTPQFATQVGADEVKLAAVKTAPKVVIEYGSKLEDVDFVVDDMKSLGIPVELKAGYENASCGRVTVNGKSVSFNQDNIYGGELGSFIEWEFQGKKTVEKYMPSCNVGA